MPKPERGDTVMLSWTLDDGTPLCGRAVVKRVLRQRGTVLVSLWVRGILPCEYEDREVPIARVTVVEWRKRR